MRRERPRRRGTERGRGVVPDRRRAARRPNACPPSSAATQPALALEPVRDVLLELRGRVLHRRAVTGEERSELARAQPAEPVEVRGQRPGVREHEHAALAEYRIAGECDRSGDERQMVGSVAGRLDRLQRPEPVAARQPLVDRSARPASAAPGKRSRIAGRPRRGRRDRGSGRSRPRPPRSEISSASASMCSECRARDPQATPDRARRSRSSSR